jgi:enoyl-CoA hydratase
MVLACDLVIAGEGSQFGIPEVKRGLAATGGGLLRLPRQLPHRIAMELALTGDMLSAERALALGLINQLVPKGQALEMSIQMARRITANGPLAVAASKQVIEQSRLWEDATMWEKQEDLTQVVLASNDAKEGATAFAEKRAPRWTRS